MIKKIILVFLFVYGVITSGLVIYSKNCLESNKEENPQSFMTERVFLSDFSNSMRTPNNKLLNDGKISYFYNLYNYSPENSYGSCGKWIR